MDAAGVMPLPEWFRNDLGSFGFSGWLAVRHSYGDVYENNQIAQSRSPTADTGKSRDLKRRHGEMPRGKFEVRPVSGSRDPGPRSDGLCGANVEMASAGH